MECLAVSFRKAPQSTEARAGNREKRARGIGETAWARNHGVEMYVYEELQ